MEPSTSDAFQFSCLAEELSLPQGALRSSSRPYCSESCPQRLKYLLSVAFWCVGVVFFEVPVDMVGADVQIWLGLCSYHAHDYGRVYMVHRSYYCMEVSQSYSFPPPDLHPSRFSLIRTQFRRQANAADNKAATVAVDSLLNYEAVKVGASQFTGFESLKIKMLIELQQRAVRGQPIRRASGRVREGICQDRNLSRVPQFGPECDFFDCADWDHVPSSARCY